MNRLDPIGGIGIMQQLQALWEKGIVPWEGLCVCTWWWRHMNGYDIMNIRTLIWGDTEKDRFHKLVEQPLCQGVR
eukprot:scaffold75965_cov58-Attheya_sp.AAC.1